jgi:hypothetical protein
MTGASRLAPELACAGMPSEHGKPPCLQELVAHFGGYDKITFEAWREYDAAIAKWQIDRIVAMGLRPISSQERKRDANHRRWSRDVDQTNALKPSETPMSAYSDKIKRLEERGLYKVKDLEDLGGEATHVISILVEDEVRFEKEMDVLYFEDTGRQLSLNPINGRTLIELFGDEPENWKGRRITLFLEEYREGKFGIRLKQPPNGGAAVTAKALATVPAGKKPPEPPPFDDDIPY